MEMADYYYLQQNHQQQQSCGLAQYRSAPISLLDNHANGSTSAVASGTTGFDEYADFQSASSSEMETYFMLSGNGSSDNVSDYHEEKAVKQEEMYQIQSLPLQSSFGVGSNEGLENSMQVPKLGNGNCSNLVRQSMQVPKLGNGNCSNLVRQSMQVPKLGNGNCSNLVRQSMQVPKLGNGNCSNLVRQSSSPAQFFSNQGLDNGFNGTRKVGTLRASNGINGEPTSTSRLYNNHISFSSGPSSYSKPLPQITENGSLVGSSNGHFIPNLITDARHNASLSGLKRAREIDGDLFCGLSKLQTQIRDSRDGSTGLTHHLSLPNTYEEMDVVDKYWQFDEGSVPCKIRAKRGFATHPRSIAERVRRTRISERIRKLQGLFPNIDKQTNTADMLDMAVECIKDLQKQVKTLRDTKAKCRC